MISHPFFQSLIGGILIGVAASLLLWLNGRLAGNSGILASCWNVKEGYWRLFYIAGLFAGGFLFQVIFPDAVRPGFHPSLAFVALAGLLVGFGSRLGSGCTSGHGVCGIARFSKRSIVATAVFMSAGMLTVWIIRILGGVWWAFH